MTKLLLDDAKERTPYNIYCYMKDPIYLEEGWQTVRSYDEFVKFIIELYEKEKVLPSVISFDHDLADEHYRAFMLDNIVDYSKFKEKTGVSCAKWFVEFCIDNNLDPLSSIIKIHTMNPVGLDNIRSIFNTYQKMKDKGYF
jgi:hypothetical protein